MRSRSRSGLRNAALEVCEPGANVPLYKGERTQMGNKRLTECELRVKLYKASVAKMLKQEAYDFPWMFYR